MTHVDTLRAATRQAQIENDLPDVFAARIFALIDRLEGSHEFRSELEALAEQVSLYDTYAQTGYIGMGVDNHILDGAISRMENRLKNTID